MHGRFQPFHLGHRAYIQEALSLADEVIVGITSPLPLAETVVEATMTPDTRRRTIRSLTSNASIQSPALPGCWLPRYVP